MNFDRNIGVITKKQQNQLFKGKVLVCGVGGMGGVCAEALVRMGVQEIYLIDPDKYDYVNLNRQIYCNLKTIGKFKVNVLKKEFLKINPKLKIKIFNKSALDLDIVKILEKVDVVVNGMDELKASLYLERNARVLNKKIVDVWLTPFVSVFVLSPKDPHWEEFLKMTTKGVELDKITDKQKFISLKNEINYTFSHFKPYKIISRKKVMKIISNKMKRPSFVVVVWLSGVLMANEVFKILTNQKHVDYRGYFFDQYNFKIIKGKINK